jgi:hypothetical protein
MQATTAQSLPNNRAATIALLAAATFAAGALLGGIAGTTFAPKTAPVAAIQASAPDVTGLRLQRQGEITVANVVGATTALRWHRYGEINAASEPDVAGAAPKTETRTTPTGTSYESAISMKPTGPRYEIVRGK